MKKYTVEQGIVAPLDRANVDTDLIIPKQFLKSIKRTGFGDNLFDEEKETSYKLEDDNVSDETINLFIPDDFNVSQESEKEENVQSLFNPEDFKDMEESSIGLNNSFFRVNVLYN